MSNENNKKNVINCHTNTLGSEYVGILINSQENRMELYLPIGYEYPNNKIVLNKENKQNIKNLIRLLAKKTEYGYEKNKNIQTDFDIFSAIMVLDDYMKYGLYKQTIKETKIKSNGRNNWKKTIQYPQLYTEEQVIYTNLWKDKINYFAEKEIQDIQEYCLSVISDEIGVFWGINYGKIKRKYSKLESEIILEKELKSINEDKKIEMLTHIYNFVNNSNFDKIQKESYLIKFKEFQYIWEDLINVIGISKKEREEYNPRAMYCNLIDNSEYPISIKVTRPDCIVINAQNLEEYIFVLDAKYYQIGEYPNENDIFKQVRYGEYVYNERNEENKTIINAFILPNHLEEEKVRVENYYAKLKKGTKMQSYEKIYIVYVDTQELINNTEKTMKKVLNDLIEKFKI